MTDSARAASDGDLVHYRTDRVLVGHDQAAAAKELLGRLGLLAEPQQPPAVAFSGGWLTFECVELRPDVGRRELEDALTELAKELATDSFGRSWVLSAVESALVESQPRGAPNIGARAVGAPTRADRPRDWRPADGSGENVTIGLLDGQVYPHPWLVGGYLASPRDTWRPAQSPLPATHATFVTGLLLAEAPAVTVRAYRLLDDDLVSDACELAEAVSQLVDRHDVDIINASFGCYTHDDRAPFALREIARALDHTGKVLVTAAGNGGGLGNGGGTATRKVWPAALAPDFGCVVSVGAVTPADGSWAVAPFSSRGDWVSLWAPGDNVLSTFIDYAGWSGDTWYHYDGWARWSGTSHAAALVSGRLAAELGGLRWSNPGATAKEALARVRASARHVAGVGRVVVPNVAL